MNNHIERRLIFDELTSTNWIKYIFISKKMLELPIFIVLIARS